MSTVNITEVTNGVKIATTTNDVTISNAHKTISIIDDNQPAVINVTQPITDIVYVATPGPQGPQGIQGPSGSAGPSVNTGSFATTGSNIFYGNQTVAANIIVTGNNKIYIENGASVPSPGISSYSDPITQLTSQGDFSGETIKGVAGENLESGQLIYLYTDGLWYKTNATPDGTNGSASATSLLGIVITTSPINTNDNIVVLLQGNVYTNQITGGEAPGSPLWINTNVGSMRNSAPAASGNIRRQVGHILTFHVVRFNPDNYYSIV
jgi:hypothetical protein